MIELIQLNTFVKSFKDLDVRTQAIILQEMEKMREGNPGNFKNLKDGVYEKKISFGPGYRIYYAKENNTVYVLILVKPKSSKQSQDIRKAKEIWEDYNG